MTTFLKQFLGLLPPGRVLDVATGSGAFIARLVEALPGYAEIVGVDTNPRGGEAFAAAFKDQSRIRFEVMDAAHLNFGDASFDLVTIANSLHHFEDPGPVLAEMLRVLRPGGAMLIWEMYRDCPSEPQLTHVYLHHWWAAVDRLQGVVHNPTYSRQELLDLAAGLGLRDLDCGDWSDLDGDPKDPQGIAALDPVIGHYIRRATGHPDLRLRGKNCAGAWRKWAFTTPRRW